MKALVLLFILILGCTNQKNSTSIAQTEVQMRAHLNEPEYMSRAQMSFHNICARCHGDHGEGGIGPNLTDKYWIHGDGQLMTLISTIQKGAPEKGMPAWEAISTQEEIELVAAYVFTLAGSNPKNAKAPQGLEK